MYTMYSIKKTCFNIAEDLLFALALTLNVFLDSIL